MILINTTMRTVDNQKRTNLNNTASKSTTLNGVTVVGLLSLQSLNRTRRSLETIKKRKKETKRTAKERMCQCV